MAPAPSPTQVRPAPQAPRHLPPPTLPHAWAVQPRKDRVGLSPACSGQLAGPKCPGRGPFWAGRGRKQLGGAALRRGALHGEGRS